MRFKNYAALPHFFDSLEGNLGSRAGVYRWDQLQL
jgi:hypothetical protein